MDGTRSLLRCTRWNSLLFSSAAKWVSVNNLPPFCLPLSLFQTLIPRRLCSDHRPVLWNQCFTNRHVPGTKYMQQELRRDPLWDREERYNAEVIKTPETRPEKDWLQQVSVQKYCPHENSDTRIITRRFKYISNCSYEGGGGGEGGGGCGQPPPPDSGD